MLALLSTRFRRWLFLMVAVPVLGRTFGSLGKRIEDSRGPSRVSRTLTRSGETLGHLSRGPLKPKRQQGGVPDGDANPYSAPARGRRNRGR